MAKIHCDIKNLAGQRPDQFPLGLADLIMQPAQHISIGARLIILHKLGRNCRWTHPMGAERLHEDPAGVREKVRLEQDYVGDCRGREGHYVQSLDIDAPEYWLCRPRPSALQGFRATVKDLLKFAYERKDVKKTVGNVKAT